MGRAHRAPCAQHLAEGDDRRRRATPSTLAASLLRRGEMAPLSTTSSILSLGLVGQFFTMLPSVLQHSRPFPLGLCIPAMEDRCRGRSRHVGGLVEHELQARVVRMLWVLPYRTLILVGAAHDLLHPRKIAHVYLIVANEQQEGLAQDIMRVTDGTTLRDSGTAHPVRVVVLEVPRPVADAGSTAEVGPVLEEERPRPENVDASDRLGLDYLRAPEGPTEG